MSKSIKISPKHGVNPTIPICFYCGESKNEVALLGRINRADDEAPMHALLDYEPCDKCKALMNQGITLIEVSQQPEVDNQPPIAPNLYPTGGWHVVTENFIRNNMQPPELVDDILKKRKALIPKGLIRTE